MHLLEHLGVALGLACLAGVNLYLTILLVGLAIRFDWMHVAAQFSSLDALAHPLVLLVAAVLFALEFFADKVPWVDSLWDSVHTFIRPVGGGLLAMQTLGASPMYIQVLAALFAGLAALTTHGAKAGTRLVVNHSPSAGRNIALSITEDLIVVAGVALLLLHPVAALGAFAGILFVLWLLFPRIWRGARTTAWFIWRKLRMPGQSHVLAAPVELEREVDDELRELIMLQAGIDGAEVRGTLRCLSGKGRGIKGLSPHLEGVLILTPRTDFLHFAATKGLSDRVFRLPLEGATFQVESGFLSENLVVESPSYRAVFCFARGEGDIAETAALRLREWTGQRSPSIPAQAPSSPASGVRTSMKPLELSKSKPAASSPSTLEPDAPTTPLLRPSVSLPGVPRPDGVPASPAAPLLAVGDPPSELALKPAPVPVSGPPSIDLEEKEVPTKQDKLEDRDHVTVPDSLELASEPPAAVSPDAPTISLPRSVVMPRPSTSSEVVLRPMEDPPAISQYPRMPDPPTPSVAEKPASEESQPESESKPEPELEASPSAPLLEDPAPETPDKKSDEPEAPPKDSLPPFPVI